MQILLHFNHIQIVCVSFILFVQKSSEFIAGQVFDSGIIGISTNPNTTFNNLDAIFAHKPPDVSEN